MTSAGRPSRFDVHLHLTKYWPDPPRTFYRPDLDYTLAGLRREMAEQRIDGGLVLQEEHAPTVEETLREARELHEGSGGKLLKSSTVDPTRGEVEVAHALELWEREPALAAIKLYPGYRHFYPSDRRLEPVYEFAERKRLVLLFHQGDTLDPNGLVKFSRPLEVDEVAVRYRRLAIVLCHFGNPWIEEAAEMVYKNENVYADTSGLVWPPTAPYYGRMVERARHRVQNAIVSIGHCERILYGSDWPLVSLPVAVSLVSELELPPEDRERILGENARRLFRGFLATNG